MGPPQGFAVSRPACRGLGPPAALRLRANAEALGSPAVRVNTLGGRDTRIAQRSQPCRVRGHPDGRQDARSTLRPSGSSCSSRRLRHGRKTRDGWVATPDPTGTLTRQETPNVSWRYNAHAQRRGPLHHPPLTGPTSRNAPRSPRPLQWVVRATRRRSPLESALATTRPWLCPAS